MDQELLYRLVGVRIRNARDRKSLSQAKLAKSLRMDRTSIVNIEKGRQHAPLHTLWEIAQQLDTEVSTFIPKRQEFATSATEVQLDAKTIEQINHQAAGDPETRNRLQEFVTWAKKRNQP
jgi:transcriptional regulator with XRE-family HTH domain